MPEVGEFNRQSMPFGSHVYEVLQQFRDEAKCSVCLSVINDVSALPCQHYFCRTCIEQCSKRECPACRKPFQKRQIKQDQQLNLVVSLFRDLYNQVAQHNTEFETLSQGFLILSCLSTPRTSFLDTTPGELENPNKSAEQIELLSGDDEQNPEVTLS